MNHKFLISELIRRIASNIIITSEGYKLEDGIYYWMTDSGKRIPVDIPRPTTRMRRDFFSPFFKEAKLSQMVKDFIKKIPNVPTKDEALRILDKAIGRKPANFSEWVEMVEKGVLKTSPAVRASTVEAEVEDFLEGLKGSQIDPEIALSILSLMDSYNTDDPNILLKEIKK